MLRHLHPFARHVRRLIPPTPSAASLALLTRSSYAVHRSIMHNALAASFPLPNAGIAEERLLKSSDPFDAFGKLKQRIADSFVSRLKELVESGELSKEDAKRLLDAMERVPYINKEMEQSKRMIFDKQEGKREEGGESKAEDKAEASDGNENSSSSEGEKKSDGKDKRQKQGGNRGDNGNKGNNSKEAIQAVRLMMFSLLAVTGLTFLLLNESHYGREISWQEFQNNLLESGKVDRIIVTNKNIARVVLRSDKVDASVPPTDAWKPTETSEYSESAGDASPNNATAVPNFVRYPTLGSPNHPTQSSFYFNIGTVDSFERKLEEAQVNLGISPKDFIPVIYVSETSWTQEFFRLLPTVLLIGFLYYMTRGAMSGVGGSGGTNSIFRIGKNTAKRVNKEQISITFADVAGCEEAKREIMEFVDFLKDPKRFTDLGAKIPKGALLCGPPGTGKTLLAKATAGEANVPFFSVSGSDFVEMFVGVGPSRVRDLFKEARENSPCILFIDEIDAVGRQRGRGGFSGANDERESTLNQLLVEMDGFDTTTNIIILAATNRIDILDSALTRPGRFDRQIFVDRPDIEGRKAIFEIYLKNLRLSGKSDEFARRLAALTPGFVGADISNICNEAAIIAARRNKKMIELADFETATERVIGGLESRKVMTAEEKRIVAYHEAGHAIAGWYLENADPLLKVTIVPRGSGALGFAQYLPKELFLRTREQLLDMICMALAGRASEQVNFGRVTTGAADDLRRVTQIVYQMVQVYGMNDSIGQVAFPKEDAQWPQERMYSNATAEKMDEEVRAIVDEAYTRTLKLVTEYKEAIRLVAELLLQKETISNADIASLIGPRPYSAGKEFDAYVNLGWTDSSANATEASETEPAPSTSVVDDQAAQSKGSNASAAEPQ